MLFVSVDPAAIGWDAGRAGPPGGVLNRPGGIPPRQASPAATG